MFFELNQYYSITKDGRTFVGKVIATENNRTRSYMLLNDGEEFKKIWPNNVSPISANDLRNLRGWSQSNIDDSLLSKHAMNMTDYEIRNYNLGILKLPTKHHPTVVKAKDGKQYTFKVYEPTDDNQMYYLVELPKDCDLIANNSLQIHKNGTVSFVETLDANYIRNIQRYYKDNLSDLNNVKIIRLTASQMEEFVRYYPFTDDVKSEQKNSNVTINSAGENKMEQESEFKKMIKQDLSDAGYRVAANQSSKLFKDAVVHLLQSEKISNESVQILGDLLDTETGLAFIQFLLGVGLHFSPKISDDERVKKISEELRVMGMAKVGDQVMEFGMEYLLPAIGEVFEGLSESNMRIAEHHEEERSDVVSNEESEEATQQASAK